MAGLKTPLFEIVDVGADVLADTPSDGVWYHVTHEKFDVFDLNAEANTFDWGTGLGVHFSRDGAGALGYFKVWPQTVRVIEAQLAIANPARFESEHNLDFLALELLKKTDGLTLEQFDLGEQNVIFEEDWVNIRDWFDEYDLDCVLYDDIQTRWCRDLVLADSRRPELRARATELVLADLTGRGHDGIVYGNEIDFACVSAVAFAVEQITITNPCWQT